MADSTPTTDPTPTGFRAWLSRQPWWVLLLASAGLLVAGGIAKHYGLPDPAVIVNLTQAPAASPTTPTPIAAQGAAPSAEMVVGQGPGRRLFAQFLRHKVERRLMTDGLKLVGGSPKPLTRAEAQKLLDRLDDEQILEGAKLVGGLGDGKILDALTKLLDWIVAHGDQIEKIVKWLMTLLALFADETPDAVGFFELPGGTLLAVVIFPGHVHVLAV